MNKNVVISMVCFVIVLAGFVFYTTAAPGKFEKELIKERGAVKFAKEVQRGNYEVLNTEDLKKMVDVGTELVLVDTMPYEGSYKKAHIPGAKQFLFPIPEMKKWSNDKTGGKTIADFKNLLGSDTEKTVVIYCGFVKCTRSHNGAMWARKLGYKNVYRHAGGIFAWKGAKYPVESVKK